MCASAVLFVVVVAADVKLCTALMACSEARRMSPSSIIFPGLSKTVTLKIGLKIGSEKGVWIREFGRDESLEYR